MPANSLPFSTPSDAPLISVLVPVYNVQEYLAECLDSVLNQTFQDFEVICINDGSTDASREIIASYLEKDSRLRVVDQVNSGYGAAMNKGLDNVRGRYVAILESDDFYELQILELLYQAISNFDAEVARANCYFYWSKPMPKNTLCEIVPHWQIGRLVNPQEERDIFYLKPAIWSSLYRRDFLEQNDIRFLETPGASYQDTSWAFKVWANAKRAVFLKQPLLHYRQDNENASVNSKAKVYCVVDEYAEIERYLDSRKVPDWQYAVKAKMMFNTYLWNYERLSAEFQLEFLQKMSVDMAADQAAGHLDWKLFEEWNRYELETILRSPEEYHQQRLASGDRGRLSKALHYLRVGGIPLLAQVVRSKFFHRY
jgi:glycosyltransferase involved in cell wall biosynthesis